MAAEQEDVEENDLINADAAEVDIFIVAVVFFINAIPFPFALLAICFLVQKHRLYHFLSHPVVIAITFLAMIVSFWVLQSYREVRKINIYGFVCI